jgi:uncharacterized protein (TIGR02271 family)
MSVTSTKGERLGKVIRCNDDTFVVEKGVFFPKDYELRYNHISDVKDSTIVYSLSDFLEREELSTERTATERAATERTATAARGPVASASGQAASMTTAATAGAAAASATATERATERAAERAPQRAADASGEIRIPLMKEEIGVERVASEVGHVRIHKTVRTEEKHFTVPVTREDVTIERVAVSRDATPAMGEATFKEETIDLPLHEEQVRVTKRPMVREEVVARTVARSVEKEGAATLRSEEAEVEDTRKPSTPTKEEATGSTAPGYRR